MKKSLLLFLTISSLSFAAASTTTGKNTSNTTTSTEGNVASSASINVNVTATVYDNTTQLIITDENGNEISAVNFEHVFTTTANTPLSGNETLSQTIYARGAGMTSDSAITNNFDNNIDKSYILKNLADSKQINGALAITKGNFDNTKGIQHTLSSTIATNDTDANAATAGVYNGVSKTLTMTFNKTTTN